MQLRIEPSRVPLRGRVSVPPDKSIGHRALIMAALATGVSSLRLGRVGEDLRRTVELLRALGVRLDETPSGEWRIHGVGLFGLLQPKAPLHVGESGTTARLMAGLLSAQEFSCGMHASAALMRRPMARVLQPLRDRGAHIKGDGFPIAFGGLSERETLRGLSTQLAVPSAQLKGALLFSGLYARGSTQISEGVVTRDHTERLMQALGVPVQRIGQLVVLDPAGWSGVVPDFSMQVPGDFSSAAALLIAALLVPGSQIEVADVGLNATRTGALDVLRAAGVHAFVEPHGEVVSEPLGDIAVHAAGGHRGFSLGGELLVRSIDEAPVLMAFAACAHGETSLWGAEELRLKESDRIEAMARTLRAFGVDVEVRTDGMRVVGRPGGLQGARVDACGDHRIAMAATLLSLAASGPSVISGAEALRKSYPGFIRALRTLGARIEVDVERDSS